MDYLILNPGTFIGVSVATISSIVLLQAIIKPPIEHLLLRTLVLLPYGILSII